jgi:hypothetical protein
MALNPGAQYLTYEYTRCRRQSAEIFCKPRPQES